MDWGRQDDALEPVRGHGMIEEERRAATSLLAHGTLACPQCDAPVAPARSVNVVAPMACPYCDHAGRVRDFLSLASPTRPAHVSVRVVNRFARG